MASMMRNILENPSTAVIFDVDGTLTDYAYGETHAQLELDFSDRERADATNIYDDSCRRIKTMRRYIQSHGIGMIACLSVEATHREHWKLEMLRRNYGIPSDRVFFVRSSEEKVAKAKEIAEMLFDAATDVVMVDDDISTLARFQQETDILTATPMIFMD